MKTSDVRCFISYRHKGIQETFARLLSRRLCRYKGINSWIDLEQLKIGGKLYEWLERGIELESDIFISILTPDYFESSNCQMELKHAVELARKRDKPILPVVLLHCRIPMFLEDIIWGDFREVYDNNQQVNPDAFKRAITKLVASIRHFAEKSHRLQQIRSSSVKSIDDLKWHLLWRVKYQGSAMNSWVTIEDLFGLYCDIIQDRNFLVSPIEQFHSDLFKIINKDKFVEGSQDKADFQYFGYHVTGLPKKFRLTKDGDSFVSRIELRKFR